MQVDLEIVLEQMGFVEIEVEMEVGVVEPRGMHAVDLVSAVQQFRVPEVGEEILLSSRPTSYLD